MRRRSSSGLAALVGAVVIIGGCGPSGSGHAGPPAQKSPGQATQGSPAPIATDHPVAHPKS